MNRDPLLDEDSTVADVSEGPPSSTNRRMRRPGISLLCAIVVAAAFDLLGPRDGEASVDEDGYELRVVHPSVTRAGSPAPARLEITTEGEFDKTVQVRLCGELFDDLDFQNWYPNPSAETREPPWIVYEFDAPPTGDTLEVRLDARTAPGQLGELDDCEVAVLEDDRPVATTSFTVWRLP